MKPLYLNFKPSIIIILSMAMVCSGVLYIIYLLPFSWQIKWLLSCTVLLFVAYGVLLRGFLVLPWSVCRLEITSQHALMLTYKNGTQSYAHRVLEDSVVMPFLAVIRLEMTPSSKVKWLLPTSLIVMPDMLDSEQFRKLRVWMRWGALYSFNAVEADADE